MTNTNDNRSKFSGSLGYVLATAGSAVGLGNIWRFPYLAAKYGGGAFVLVYIILAFTFGYTLMTSETVLGRLTGKSPVSAYHTYSKSRWSTTGGWINAIVPMIILPYYSVIGGWVIKYLVTYITGNIKAPAQDGFFGSFIGSAAQSEGWFIVFAALTLIVILFGVESGVERVSKMMMPALVVLAIIVAIYSCTRPGAVEGIKYFFIPNFKNFSIMTVVAAMGQMFYSLSVAMGILITYGSYMKKDVDVDKSTKRVILFDSGIAILAALMIIPAVFAFSGGAPEQLQAGPSLMFVMIPKVFESMGLGKITGFLFFLLVLFAALTSSISLAETSAATFVDEFGWSRKKATGLVLAIMLTLGSLSSLGYNVLGNVKILGLQFLDFFDFISNSIMMPIAAFATCILIIRVVGRENIEKEISLSSNFKWKGVYETVLRFIAPVFLMLILLSSILSFFGIISI